MLDIMGPNIHNSFKEGNQVYHRTSEQFRNFRHKYDVIGNTTGNTTQTKLCSLHLPCKR